MTKNGDEDPGHQLCVRWVLNFGPRHYQYTEWCHALGHSKDDNHIDDYVAAHRSEIETEMINRTSKNQGKP
jgi:hypothetical protein